MLGGISPQMRAVLQIGLLEDEKLQGAEKSPVHIYKDLIFFAVNFATEEMSSFPDRSDATETPNMDSLSHIFRVFEPNSVREIFILVPRNYTTLSLY